MNNWACLTWKSAIEIKSLFIIIRLFALTDVIASFLLVGHCIRSTSTGTFLLYVSSLSLAVEYFWSGHCQKVVLPGTHTGLLVTWSLYGLLVTWRCYCQRPIRTQNKMPPVSMHRATDSKDLLRLSVLKTKEMLIDFRKNPPSVPYVEIDDKIVERVENYKYLGTVIDSSLAFNKNVDAMHRKCQLRLLLAQAEKHWHWLQDFANVL